MADLWRTPFPGSRMGDWSSRQKIPPQFLNGGICILITPGTVPGFSFKKHQFKVLTTAPVERARFNPQDYHLLFGYQTGSQLWETCLVGVTLPAISERGIFVLEMSGIELGFSNAPPPSIPLINPSLPLSLCEAVITAAVVVQRVTGVFFCD